MWTMLYFLNRYPNKVRRECFVKRVLYDFFRVGSMQLLSLKIQSQF